MKDKSKILIVPSPLGQRDLIREIYSEVGDIFKIERYFVETPKIGRSVISQIEQEKEIQSVDLLVLDKNTRTEEIEDYIHIARSGVSVLLSDNGLPGISDPGREFIRLAHKANIEIIPTAATSSITTALACSGLNGEQFVYHGYAPRLKEKRIDFIKGLENSSLSSGATQIFIETPYRNKHVWKDIMNFCNDQTQFSISIDLFEENCTIKTATVGDWKKMKWPELKDKRAVYLINSHPDVKKAQKRKRSN